MRQIRFAVQVDAEAGRVFVDEIGRVAVEGAVQTKRRLIGVSGLPVLTVVFVGEEVECLKVAKLWEKQIAHAKALEAGS